MILGHRHPEVIEAILRALERGTSFGAPTDLEIELADLIVGSSLGGYGSCGELGHRSHHECYSPGRAATGRDKIIKFEGCYHGHGDSLLIEAGSGVATMNIPVAPV